ncbi:hypothetical protein JMJ35_009267 [Cladonia borealis]|uniref:Uncharacterized protein n=1 Tax=Cladonia borealis TaxID=184061 RepID=A0AA39UXZ2_9LECA|nr:hypothetical protein JMJ35_009267 [Cladonia borealis]
MSLTPLYPHGPTFRLKAVVENRQKDVMKVEELEDQRLLAALVASLDMKLNYKKIAHYHGTTLSTTVLLLHPALLDASMLIRAIQIEAEQGPSSSIKPTAKAEFIPALAPRIARHGMNVKRPPMYIAQLRTARQSMEKTKEEGEINKGVVMMSKRLEDFEIGRDIAYKTRSILGKRRREKDELEEDSA